MIVKKFKNAGFGLLPVTLSLALGGWITKPDLEAEKIEEPTNSAVAAADENFISLETYRAQSQQTILDLGLANPEMTRPGTEWRSWDTPALSEFNLWDRLLQQL